MPRRTRTSTEKVKTRRSPNRSARRRAVIKSSNPTAAATSRASSSQVGPLYLGIKTYQKSRKWLDLHKTPSSFSSVVLPSFLWGGGATDGESQGDSLTSRQDVPGSFQSRMCGTSKKNRDAHSSTLKRLPPNRCNGSWIPVLSLSRYVFSGGRTDTNVLNYTEAYRRTLDILNRGFGGYNTITSVHSLPSLL